MATVSFKLYPHEAQALDELSIRLERLASALARDAVLHVIKSGEAPPSAVRQAPPRPSPARRLPINLPKVSAVHGPQKA